MIEEGQIKIITISYFMDSNLYDVRVKSLANQYVNNGIPTLVATTRAKLNTSNISATQILRIRDSLYLDPITDFIDDIAKGRRHSFSVEIIK